MPVKRVFLHLGMSKSGSTSIQNALFHNAAILEKNSFRYLTEWDENHLVKFKSLFSPYHIVNRKRINDHFVKKMLNVITTTDCETLILSGEYSYHLWHNTTVENIKQFIENYFQTNGIEVTIIFIVRNPLTWFISFMQQRLFKSGFLMNKNEDFFEVAIKQYKGVLNLKKYFPDSIKLIKFEDACLDKNGLVGVFLREVHFPEELLKSIIFKRQNESRCMEVMEFIYYIEATEPRYPYVNNSRSNPNRFRTDLMCLKDIRGVKFDLPYQSKVELWERLQETVHLLKGNTGIDYTDYSISNIAEQETYSEQTIQEFVDIFPKLNFVLQKHFLKFFEKKYMETAQVKFKQLHFKDSIPWGIYNHKNAFISILYLRIQNMAYKIIPRKIKKTLRGLLGRS